MKTEHVGSLFFFMSILCLHYGIMLEDFKKQCESGNKISIAQIAPEEKKVNASEFEILCLEK